MVVNLQSESPSDSEVWSQDFSYNKYANDIVQIVYLSAKLDIGGNLTRHAKRTSIWVNEFGKWQMKFHLATPVSAFEKSSA